MHSYIFESFKLYCICNQVVTTHTALLVTAWVIAIVLMALSFLAIYCLLMSGCMQLLKVLGPNALAEHLRWEDDSRPLSAL